MSTPEERLRALGAMYLPIENIKDTPLDRIVEDLKELSIEVSKDGYVILNPRLSSSQTPEVFLNDFPIGVPDLDRLILSYITDPRVLLALIKVNRYLWKIHNSPWFRYNLLDNLYGLKEPYKSDLPYWEAYLRSEFTYIPAAYLNERDLVFDRRPNLGDHRTDLLRVILLGLEVSPRTFDLLLERTTQPRTILLAWGLASHLGHPSIFPKLIRRIYQVVQPMTNDPSKEILFNALILFALDKGQPAMIRGLFDCKAFSTVSRDYVHYVIYAIDNCNHKVLLEVLREAPRYKPLLSIGSASLVAYRAFKEFLEESEWLSFVQKNVRDLNDDDLTMFLRENPGTLQEVYNSHTLIISLPRLQWLTKKGLAHSTKLPVEWATTLIEHQSVLDSPGFFEYFRFLLKAYPSLQIFGEWLPEPPLLFLTTYEIEAHRSEDLKPLDFSYLLRGLGEACKNSEDLLEWVRVLRLSKRSLEEHKIFVERLLEEGREIEESLLSELISVGLLTGPEEC